ncbi:MAG: signal peptidase I [Pirellula sp.]|jgi:signal peptidase I|nr:signal peptidase I [Pirellula sp.]
MASDTTEDLGSAEPVNQSKVETAAADSKEPPSKGLVVRETVESLAVAFILALLFKAFIAEAFVIPTGSMAPTLMGAHKDIACECCGHQFQCGASEEFDRETGKRINRSVVGAVCPLCRKPQIIDPFQSRNHATFSGDRILVSKLAYVWKTPNRWDVIVFKFIEEARQNYIKRCVGLPNEVVRVQGGDIYTRSTLNEDSSFSIARKPPHVVNAMLQPVHDTKFAPSELIKAGMPSAWQTLSPDESSWSVVNSENEWKATVENKETNLSWLRYFPKIVDTSAWRTLESTGSLPAPMDPRQPRLITDFTAYNSAYAAPVQPSRDPKEKYREAAENSLRNLVAKGNDGIHWVGDLACEYDVETTSGSKQLSLLLVEAGAKHQIDIDLSSGVALASVYVDDQPVAVIEDGEKKADKASAETEIRAGKKHRIRFANVDDQLILWVDGKLAQWTPSNRIYWGVPSAQKQRGPRQSQTDPLDGAPVGIAVSGGIATVHRARVFRDIYYIAAMGGDLTDYPNTSEAIRRSLPAGALEDYAKQVHNDTPYRLQNLHPDELNRNALAMLPNAWGQGEISQSRRTRDFPMQSKWYFPMGDNSSASSDARSWAMHHTPERLLIGRAVVVFWPHCWNAPVPFLPNVQRMGLIR